MRISDWSSDVCSSELAMDAPNPIIVQGFTPRYAAAFRELLGTEGGHVNDRFDMGGETKVGISLRFLKAAGKIRSEEHTSELQSLMRISYAVFCLKKKKT